MLKFVPKSSVDKLACFGVFGRVFCEPTVDSVYSLMYFLPKSFSFGIRPSLFSIAPEDEFILVRPTSYMPVVSSAVARSR